jgi:hypothetical protein
MGTGFAKASFGDCIRWDRATTGISIITIINLPSWRCISYVHP